jgi:hypothetical protein
MKKNEIVRIGQQNIEYKTVVENNYAYGGLFAYKKEIQESF